ncbi:MAG: transposase [Chthoniobacterales bacterium]
MEFSEESGRKRPLHFPVTENSNQSLLIFVTVCTKDRKPILADPAIHALLRKWWSNATEWLVGRYVITPEHIHLFCAPNNLEVSSLRNWMAFWKNGVSREWPSEKDKPIWQRSFWDTQLRQGESYTEKWEYVRNNPVRHGLVTDTKTWPYQGEMNILPWHDT